MLGVRSRSEFTVPRRAIDGELAPEAGVKVQPFRGFADRQRYRWSSRQARAERAVGGRRVPFVVSLGAPSLVDAPAPVVYKKRSTLFDVFRTARM